jgi:hypothetical protein
MALSNWDTLAFGLDGQPCNGVFSHEGNSVQIYKNWIYISSEKMWTEESGFSKNVIAAIERGTVQLAGFNIRVVEAHFCGVGVYGFQDNVPMVLKKLGREGDEDKGTWIEGSTHGGDKGAQYHIQNIETGEKIVFHDEDKDGKYEIMSNWVGVEPDTANQLFEWISQLAEFEQDEGMEEWIEKCRTAKALRFNQGDQYFADNMGFDVPTTEVGEAEKPIIGNMLKDKEE